MKEKTVLITGASSGFGFEFVKLFLKDNFELILVARDIEKLNEIKNQFPGCKIIVIQKDLTKGNAVKEIYSEIKAKGMKVDILVNNAGFGLMGNFDILDINEQLNMIQLNVTALTELTYYALQDMKESGGGKILNVASTAAFQPGPLMAIYYATKAFVLSFSEALVEELRETNITVTTLCPGPSKTNFAKVANIGKSKLFSKVMNADVVARIGYKALMSGQRVVISGKMNKVAAYASKFLPRSFTVKIVKIITRD